MTTGETICVIVAAHNTAHNSMRQLEGCLRALAGQSLQRSEYEIIVVTTDPDEAHRAIARLGLAPTAHAVASDGATRAAVWNEGAAQAQGHWLMFLDAAQWLGEFALASHVAAQRAAGGAFVSCALDAHRPAGPAPADVGAQTNGGLSFAVQERAVVSVPRAAFASVGGFRARLPAAEITELCCRLRQAGVAEIVLNESNAVFICAMTLAEEAALSAALGEASVALYQLHPELLPRIPLGRFHDGGMRGIVLRRLLLWMRFPLALLLRFVAIWGQGRAGGAWRRFAREYAYWCGVRRAIPGGDLWQRLTRGPVILMYHAVGGQSERASCYIIPERRFARQIAWLKQRSYNVMPLADLALLLREHRLPPARSVIITFDDGYADNHSRAYPVLRRHCFPATVFIVSGRVGGTNDWDRSGELAGRSMLTWADIREMCDSGFSVGAHGTSHRLLEGLAPGPAREEIESSKNSLESALGASIEAFAYPGGRYDRSTQAVVEQSGFTCACCSEPGVNGLAAPVYALRRIEMRGTDSLAGFALALWLGKNQVMSRLWKAQ